MSGSSAPAAPAVPIKPAAPAGGRPPPPFRFMSWNIYAHSHTNWAKFAHDNGNLESRTQMVQRHTLIVKAISEGFPDIVALQEVDTSFMGPNWDPQREPLPCGQRLTQYVPYQDYSYAGVAEGTAILLKRGVYELDPDAPHPRDASVYGCTDTGGKSATVLWARRVGVPNSTVAVVSVHLKGCPPPEWKEGHTERRFLLREVSRSLHRYPAPVVLAGDFNVRSGEFLDRLCKLLYKELGILKMSSPKNVPTSLMSDFRYDTMHRIDYIYLSPELKPHEKKPLMGKLPGDGDRYDDRGPFGIDKGNGSDHRWLMAILTLQPPATRFAFPATATTAPHNPNPSSAGNSFTFLQWNVLASNRTSQYHLQHQQPNVESDEQRLARHQRVIQAIQREQPDVAALQDVDETLFPLDWDPAQPLPCGETLEGYTVHRCQADGAGTAILLRQGVYEVDPSAPTMAQLSVQPSEENAQRSCTVLWLRRKDAPRQRFAVASAQLKEYSGSGDDAEHTQRYSVLKAAALNIKPLPGPVLVAGDFGTRPDELNWLAPALGKELKMKPLDLKCSLPTALMPDLGYDPAHRVDYLFVTNGVQLIGPPRLGALPGETEAYDGLGPYGSDPGDGSDHRYVLYTVEILWAKWLEFMDAAAAPDGTAVPEGKGDEPSPKRPKTDGGDSSPTAPQNMQIVLLD
eukprot:EG_transcript_4601